MGTLPDVLLSTPSAIWKHERKRFVHWFANFVPLYDASPASDVFGCMTRLIPHEKKALEKLQDIGDWEEGAYKKGINKRTGKADHKLTEAVPRGIRTWLREHFGAQPGEYVRYPTCHNGPFISTRAVLQRRPRDEFEKLRKLVDVGRNPETGIYVERAAMYFFGRDAELLPVFPFIHTSKRSIYDGWMMCGADTCRSPYDSSSGTEWRARGLSLQGTLPS